MSCLGPARADIRIATFAAELYRDGPGILVRDLADGRDPAVEATVEILATVAPDILVLTRIDHDADLVALGLLRDRLKASGLDYPHVFAAEPNSGMATGVDLDGDGRLGTPRDAQGYGRFRGARGMAILSRFPILRDRVRDFSALLWKDLPGDGLDPPPFPSAAARAVQRLSSTGHWIVPIAVDERHVLNVLAFAATAPVFDGPEDRNGIRNRDEIRLWTRVLDGLAPDGQPLTEPFVIAGLANLDPFDGEGRHDAIRQLLAHPRLQDPKPKSEGGAAQAQKGASAHRGDPALDTASWPGEGPGALRVDYVLPSAELRVTGSGVFWPTEGPGARAARLASAHRLVWVDVAFPD
ncbi:MAG: endonuclease/exonuclease/phosphatase family protein [Alphaproteobacteria bacterium]|nr:MAG: endonuclease/exonuclease/phosphatase family protein [Alphaproteobacteria bacterium]